jgi:hypothetical protein
LYTLPIDKFEAKKILRKTLNPKNPTTTMVKKIKNALTNLDQMLDPKTNNKIAILVVIFFSLANLDPRRFEQKP